jgi:hypothetical protein
LGSPQYPATDATIAICPPPPFTHRAEDRVQSVDDALKIERHRLRKAVASDIARRVPDIPACVEQSQRDRPIELDPGDELRHLTSIRHVARRSDD